MNNWTSRRNTFQVSRTGSTHYKKPNLGNDRYVWKPTIPSWEKKFCKEIGNMSWRRFLKAEKDIHIHSNVIDWKDSAVEEAFHNAKKRFWANINELPCDIPLSDPDIHNDVIDWDNNDVDPELILDLDRKFVVPDDQEEVIIGLPDTYAGYSIGWGDLDDIPNAKNNVVEPLPPTGSGESLNEPIHEWGESYKHIVATGWGNDNNYVTGDNDYGSYKHIIANECVYNIKNVIRDNKDYNNVSQNYNVTRNDTNQQNNSSTQMSMYNFLRFSANGQNWRGKNKKNTNFWKNHGR